MVTVSVIIPVYNTEKYIAQAIQSVLAQSFQDFELIIVDDESSDESMRICSEFKDTRIRIVHQSNLGLAGARNSGIHYAKGKYIALLDSDDYWSPKKLESHVAHLESNEKIGISYCPSVFVDDDGNLLGIKQTPKLKSITAKDIFCRNPIGNGSAPVIRKSVFDAIAFAGNNNSKKRMWYFDETFRQSEDIECWLRIALQTNWIFEGIPDALTFYRVNSNGLSANIAKQFESWERVWQKLSVREPVFFSKWGSQAKAYQLRYLARRAIKSRESSLALKLVLLAIETNFSILFKEPGRTLSTLCCAILINLLPGNLFTKIEGSAIKLIGLLG